MKWVNLIESNPYRIINLSLNEYLFDLHVFFTFSTSIIFFFFFFQHLFLSFFFHFSLSIFFFIPFSFVFVLVFLLFIYFFFSLWYFLNFYFICPFPFISLTFCFLKLAFIHFYQTSPIFCLFLEYILPIFFIRSFFFYTFIKPSTRFSFLQFSFFLFFLNMSYIQYSNSWSLPTIKYFFISLTFTSSLAFTIQDFLFFTIFPVFLSPFGLCLLSCVFRVSFLWL